MAVGRVQVLVEGAAMGHVHQLQAAADREDGQIERQGLVQETDLYCIALGVALLGMWMARLAVSGRVDIGASGKNQARMAVHAELGSWRMTSGKESSRVGGQAIRDVILLIPVHQQHLFNWGQYQIAPFLSIVTRATLGTRVRLSAGSSLCNKTACLEGMLQMKIGKQADASSGKWCNLVLSPILVLGIAWAQLSAQTCKPGELRVLVKDSQEGPIFDAQVKIETLTKTTGTGGIVDFTDLPCGAYTIVASKPGFDDGKSAVVIGGGASVEVNITLNPQVVRSSVDVTATAAPVEQTASETTELRPDEVKTLPSNPVNVADTLVLVPGVVRSPEGELKINGTGEQRSALVVNQSDITDPATGKFGQTIPIDSIEAVNVLNTPFLAQYGRFTQSVVAVETRRGGEKWHADLNDLLPDFRIRSYQLRGIRNETPRGVLSGPLLRDRLYFITSLTYFLDKSPSRTLPFPHNESKQEAINSFSQFDYLLSTRQILTATVHLSPQHTNFISPDYFNPQPVTPSYAQHNYLGTFAHHLGIFGGTLDSSVSLQRFDATVGAQGDAAMTLTPTGNSGNYFATQDRDARRTEWLEIWSPTSMRLAGTHILKIGTSLTGASDQGQFTYRPVDILYAGGQLLEHIAFTNGLPFNRHDLEVTAYGQDHWALNSKFAFDYGLRVEHQRLAQSLRIAPRAGIVWTPITPKTVFRAGYGQFYDHIPLDVYTFSRYPQRTITDYAQDGSLLGSAMPYINVIGSVTGPRSFFVRGQQVAGAFSPRGFTWTAQVEHSFSKMLRIRAVYLDNRSVGLIVLEPALLGTVHEIVLNGDGSSRHRQAEVSAKSVWKEGQQLTLTYVRSRTRGSLNTFDTFLGNFPFPLVRSNLYANLPDDLPNRFLMWGKFKTRVWGLEAAPIVEYRNGLPFASLDQSQNYAGTPYRDQTRFPRFFSADLRVLKDLKINPKYTLRLSLSGFNLTNHFNALAIHSNISDPQYGVFFGNYHRRYRFDLEVVF